MFHQQRGAHQLRPEDCYHRDCWISLAAIVPPAFASDGQCVPGATKRIAFMLKQQTAFRYLHADIRFSPKRPRKPGTKSWCNRRKT